MEPHNQSSRLTTDKALLSAQNVCKSFSGVTALRNATLSVGPGQIHSLIGENGSGKSTLIKIIAGVLPPDSGFLFWNGRQLDRQEPIDAIRLGVQVIYQDLSLFPNLSVAENIALGAELSSGNRLVNRKRMETLASEALGRLGISLDLFAAVETLPMAKRQLIAICRALAQNARLVIMDEPTAALTRKEIAALFRAIKRLQGQGVSTLFVSHKLDEVLEISDVVSVLRDGRIVAEGATHEFSSKTLTEAMTGRSWRLQSGSHSPPNPPSGQEVLRTRALSGRNGFREISFSLHPGEIVGLTGLLGSGRTSLAMALAGLIPADSGEIFIDGKPVRIGTPGDALSFGIGYVPEDRLTEGLFPEHSVAINLMANSLDKLTGRMGLMKWKRADAFAERLAREMKLTVPSLDTPVETLSGGNQQRVLLGRWLATAPKILILNRPTVGVDVASKFDLHAQLLTMAEQGLAILLISDDLPELFGTCSRLILMKQGTIEETFSISETTQNELSIKLTA